ADDDETAAPLFDDLDDFNGLTETRGADTISGAGGLLFDVVYRVRYVVPSTLSVASVPTLAKEFEVSVAEVPSAATRGRPPVRAVLRKVFTPAGMASFR
ncbi:MAG TPA: hypothetical protein VF594_11805, partial [Rubricoccaceae bacterium]